MRLYEAVQSGDAAAVKAALEDVKDVNELGPGGRTALIEAAAAGRADLVKLLIAAGAEPAWKDDEQETALLKAAANGHREVVALLIDSGTEDERDLARAFLAAYGQSHGPEYQLDESSLKRKAVEVAARAANFVGHESPLTRVDRVERAEAAKKKR
ncbi:MAG: ankyrin repeat domain-containing protein [Myxococcota bacterium]|jgi:ankyrin repeat protein